MRRMKRKRILGFPLRGDKLSKEGCLLLINLRMINFIERK